MKRRLLALLALGPLVAPVSATTWTVTLSGFAFTPPDLTIRVGDTVTWDNVSGFHNVVADDGSFGSGDPAGAPWQFSHTFERGGVFGYHCQVHGAPGSGMFATLTVEPAADEIVHTVSAWDFAEPSASTTVGSGYYRGVADDTNAALYAGLSLPSGSVPTRLEIEACGSEGAGGPPSIQVFLETCPLNTATCADSAFIGAQFEGPAACATFHDDVSGVTIGNLNHDYVLHVGLFGTASSTLSFRAVRVFYRRQVGPAPDQPRFADVSASSLYFQYVEALAAAGVTTGCGAGHFCPDNPVTRAQLALILAKLMGLTPN